MENYFYGIGRRKSAIARVRIFKGTGKVFKSDKTLIENATFIENIKKPLELVSEAKNFDISVKLCGGGWNSQTGAAMLGVARALCKVNDEFEKTLKKEGLLTRDPREKERKKPGLRGARRAPQWAKR